MIVQIYFINMTSKELIDLIEGDKTKLKNWFENFDKQSNSITQWCKLLYYPNEENYSYWICHKIRNHIASGLNYHFGVGHLNNQKFPSIAETSFKDAIEVIQKGEAVRTQLLEVYPKIVEIIY